MNLSIIEVQNVSSLVAYDKNEMYTLVETVPCITQCCAVAVIDDVE